MASGLVKTPAPLGPDKLVSAISETAQTARHLLTAMLVVALTLTATLVAATDEALFFDSAEVFPSLGVRIKLSTAFTLAPPLFVFLHVNALLQIHLLTGRIRALDKVLCRAKVADLTAWHGLISGFAFAQLLAGTRGLLGGGLYRGLLAIVSWFSIVAVPVGLLMATQMAFLRYQSEAITLLHQTVLTLDVFVLIWSHLETWGAIGASTILRSGWSLLAAASTGLVLWFSWLQAVPAAFDLPTDAVHGVMPDKWYRTRLSAYEIFSEYLLAPVLRGEAFLPDQMAALTGWPWTRRFLDLRGRALLNLDAKPDLLRPFSIAPEGMMREQRRMVAAAVAGRSFRFANFHSARLFAANMLEVDARSAGFRNAQMQGVNLGGAGLVGADLSEAALHGGNLSVAMLIGAKLDRADLSAADLGGANLMGATLREAKLHGAILEATSLDAADLTEADFLGASFDLTDVPGAVLYRARLDFAHGTMLGCGEAAGEPLPATSRKKVRSELASFWAQSHLAEDLRKEILEQLKGPSAGLTCEGQSWPRGAWNDAAPAKLADAWRRVACRDPMLARSLVASVVGGTPYSVAVAEALSRPPGPHCRGLAALPAKELAAMAARVEAGDSMPPLALSSGWPHRGRKLR